MLSRPHENPQVSGSFARTASIESRGTRWVGETPNHLPAISPLDDEVGKQFFRRLSYFHGHRGLLDHSNNPECQI